MPSFRKSFYSMPNLVAPRCGASSAVCRVLRIDWPTIVTDIAPIAAPGLLVAVMADDAQRLQLAGPERVPIATVRDDVIGDRGWHRDAASEAEGAQWACSQLGLRAIAPALQLIPIAPTSIDFLAAHPRPQGLDFVPSATPWQRLYSTTFQRATSGSFSMSAAATTSGTLRPSSSSRMRSRSSAVCPS